MSVTINCSFVPRAQYTGDVLPWSGTFDDLEAVFRETGNTVSGKDGPAVAVSSFVVGDGTTPSTMGKRGRFRQEALVDQTFLLGLDFDERMGDALEIAAPLERFDCILYSSHSHGRHEHLRAKLGKAGKDVRLAEAPRFRAMVRFARSVSPTEYRALHRWFDRFCGGGSDLAVGDPTRLFYTPRLTAPDAVHPAWIVRFRGEALDPDNLPDGASIKELLAAQALAGAAAPRAPLAPAEAKARVQRWADLDPVKRAVAADMAHLTIQGALVRASTATERRPAFFVAACRIGEAQGANLLTDDEVQRYCDELLSITSSLLVSTDEKNDLPRQLKNGLKRGKDSPRDPASVVLVAGAHKLSDGRRRLPIVDNDDSEEMDLERGRELCRERVGASLEEPGAYAVAADPGVGKTHEVIGLIADMWLAGKNIRIAVPTNKLAQEVLTQIRRTTVPKLSALAVPQFLNSVGIDPKRQTTNCSNFDAVTAGRRAGGRQGALAVCRACNLHPSNNEGGGYCGFFREVFKAKAYSVTVTTHELELLRGEATHMTVVDVKAFKRAAKEKNGGRYRPHASLSFNDGLVLTLIPDDDGELPPPFVVGVADDETCLQWLGQQLRCAGVVDVIRQKLINGAAGAVDLLVIDERPKAADAKRSVTLQDVEAWRAAGDLTVTDAAVGALHRLTTMGTSTMSGGLAEAIPRESMTARRVATRGVVSRLGSRLLTEHAADAAHGDSEAVAVLQAAPDYDALPALEAACARGWTGCYVNAAGLLHLTHPRPIARAGVRSVLYLDGTATRESSQALLGPDCEYTRIKVKLHPESKVIRVDWGASKNALPLDENNARRRATLQKLAALVKRYETTTTAWVLHKAWVDDDDVKELLADALEAKRVTWFGSADAVGSNRLKNCTRIVLADWHTPLPAQVAMAETYAIRAAADPELAGVDWLEHAAHALEGSEIIQAMYRVRPAEHAREIVLVTDRAVPWVHDLVGIDELLATELGLLPAGARGAVMLLQQEVSQSGCVALGSRIKGNRHVAQRVLDDLPVTPDTALQRAGVAFERIGGAPTWAASAGLHCAYARTSTGAPVPIAFAGGPPPWSTVARLLAELGHAPAWIEWQGERHALEDGAGAALEALRLLPKLEAVSWDALADALDVAPITARRRLGALGISSLEALRDRWVAMVKPEHVVIETPDGPRVALVGGGLWSVLVDDDALQAWEVWLACTASSATSACPGVCRGADHW